MFNPDDTPIEWLMEAHNQAVYGNIPALENLAKGALTGLIETNGDSLCESSIWSRGLRDEQCRVSYSRIFDRPIYLPESALSNVDFDDDFLYDLPYYEVEKKRTWVSDYALSIPLNKGIFDNISNLGVLSLDLCESLKESILDENGNLKKFSYLYVNSGNRIKIVKFYGEIFTETDSNGNPVLYPSIYEKDKMVTRRRLRLFF